MPQVVAPGAAWPVRYQFGWRNGCITSSSWFVLVALPPVDRAETVAAGDELLDAVGEALWKVGQVEGVIDWQWPVANQRRGAGVAVSTQHHHMIRK